VGGEEAHRLLVGKPEGKRPLGRPICRWVDNIRMDLGEMGLGDFEWIGLGVSRVAAQPVASQALLSSIELVKTLDLTMRTPSSKYFLKVGRL
jgi:hypothetical protein